MCQRREVRGTVHRWWAIREQKGRDMSNNSNKRSVQHISGMTQPQKRCVRCSEWRVLIGEAKVTKKRRVWGGTMWSFYPGFLCSLLKNKNSLDVYRADCKGELYFSVKQERKEKSLPVLFRFSKFSRTECLNFSTWINFQKIHIKRLVLKQLIDQLIGWINQQYFYHWFVILSNVSVI